MDDIVKQAMVKWPDVPDCFGWLGLDARGNWYMRDERIQMLGAFDGANPASKGSLLQHDKLIEFIGRNYGVDLLGQWYFQNGPQRVYVELQATPLIWRIQGDFSVKDHIGRSASVRRCILDEIGHVYLESDAGFGMVHTQDMGLAADAIELGIWVPQNALRQTLPESHGFVKSPQALQKK
jgi:hypothetical protein